MWKSYIGYISAGLILAGCATTTKDVELEDVEVSEAYELEYDYGNSFCKRWEKISETRKRCEIINEELVCGDKVFEIYECTDW